MKTKEQIQLDIDSLTIELKSLNQRITNIAIKKEKTLAEQEAIRILESQRVIFTSWIAALRYVLCNGQNIVHVAIINDCGCK